MWETCCGDICDGGGERLHDDSLRVLLDHGSTGADEHAGRGGCGPVHTAGLNDMDRCPHDVWRDRSAISSSMRDGGRSRELSRLPGEIYRVRRAERERQSPMIGGRRSTQVPVFAGRRPTHLEGSSDPVVLQPSVRESPERQMSQKQKMSDMSDKCPINVRYLAGYTLDTSCVSGAQSS